MRKTHFGLSNITKLILAYVENVIWLMNDVELAYVECKLAYE
ncbi:hypothetical protein HMPREF3224_01017 [Anaerococcus hydrogenalis]|nr:hypothetical protein HMPREF3224_01017 [Anaerococcus hydrogenalis]